jgi:hypothetical protein
MDRQVLWTKARADTNLAVDVVVGGVEDEGNVVALLGVEVIKLFHSSLTARANKLERLSL